MTRTQSRLARLTAAVALLVAPPSAWAQTAPPTPPPAPPIATPPPAAGRATAPDQPVTLESTTWTLTHLGLDPVAPPSSSRAPSLRFHAPERRVSGATGCNRLSGSYTREGNKLRFLPLVTTRMLCPNAMDLEARFLGVLERVTRFRIVGTRLNLYDVKGVVVARFTPGPP